LIKEKPGLLSGTLSTVCGDVFLHLRFHIEKLKKIDIV